MATLMVANVNKMFTCTLQEKTAEMTCFSITSHIIHTVISSNITMII